MKTKNKRKLKTLAAILNTLLLGANLQASPVARRKVAKYLLEKSPLGDAIENLSREDVKSARNEMADENAARIEPSNDNAISVMLLARLNQLGVNSNADLRAVIFALVFKKIGLEQWLKDNILVVHSELWAITEPKPRNKSTEESESEEQAVEGKEAPAKASKKSKPVKSDNTEALAL